MPGTLPELAYVVSVNVYVRAGFSLAAIVLFSACEQIEQLICIAYSDRLVGLLERKLFYKQVLIFSLFYQDSGVACEGLPEVRIIKHEADKRDVFIADRVRSFIEIVEKTAGLNPLFLFIALIICYLL